MDDNIKITLEEIKIRLESELLEIKREISDFLIPKDKSEEKNNDIIKILREREEKIKKSLDKLKKNWENYKKCTECREIIEDKRFFVDATADKCKKHIEI